MFRETQLVIRLDCSDREWAVFLARLEEFLNAQPPPLPEGVVPAVDFED